jgi:hypothetical protein
MVPLGRLRACQGLVRWAHSDTRSEQHPSQAADDALSGLLFVIRHWQINIVSLVTKVMDNKPRRGDILIRDSQKTWIKPWRGGIIDVPLQILATRRGSGLIWFLVLSFILGPWSPFGRLRVFLSPRGLFNLSPAGKGPRGNRI